MGASLINNSRRTKIGHVEAFPVLHMRSLRKSAMFSEGQRTEGHLGYPGASNAITIIVDLRSEHDLKVLLKVGHADSATNMQVIGLTSERVVGDCLRAGPTRAVIASKFLPFPGRTSPRRLMSALDGSLARLGLKTIDLYYVHYPLPLIDVGVFAEGLVDAVKSDKSYALGVANFNADQ